MALLGGQSFHVATVDNLLTGLYNYIVYVDYLYEITVGIRYAEELH